MSRDILRDLRGFGTVEKWVLTDPKISVTSKAIYALLCSFAGNKGVAFPGAELMCSMLNISRGTLFKYIKELKDHNVILVEQKREKGQFNSNIYTLLPQNYIVTEYQNTAHGKTEFGETEDGKAEYDETEDGDLDANNNSLKNNSLKSNRLNNAPADLKLLLERNIDEQLANDFLQVRKAKRAPLTLTAVEGLEREAGKANLSFEQVIRLCVERGWQGFSASWSIPSNAPAVNDFNSQDYGKPVIPNFRKK